jgi:hypothetical protein
LTDVDLIEIAQVVEGGRRHAQPALLLDGGRLGIALGDDETPQLRTILTGHLLPRRLALMLAEVDLAVLLGRGEEDAPAVFRHLHVVEMRPA